MWPTCASLQSALVVSWTPAELTVCTTPSESTHGAVQEFRGVQTLPPPVQVVVPTGKVQGAPVQPRAVVWATDTPAAVRQMPGVSRQVD